VRVEVDEPEEGSIAHYGVKGMRWGHRKAAESGGSASAQPKKQKYAVSQHGTFRERYKKSAYPRGEGRYFPNKQQIMESRAILEKRSKELKKLSAAERQARTAKSKAKATAAINKALTDPLMTRDMLRGANPGRVATIGGGLVSPFIPLALQHVKMREIALDLTSSAGRTMSIKPIKN
jgi:hypothetical protein